LQLEEEKPVASSTTAPPTEEVAASLNPQPTKSNSSLCEFVLPNELIETLEAHKSTGKKAHSQILRSEKGECSASTVFGGYLQGH
jgi:hypothetical protein